MIYLTVQRVLILHHRIIEKTGGSHGVHDLGLLESAVARPQSTYGGEDLYDGLFSKAAALLESLARNHPFVDGNKRTAIAAASLFLRINGRRVFTSNGELEDYAVYVVVSNPGVESIARWLEEKSRPYSG